MSEEIEEGYYWVLLHPIFESGWTVGFHDYNGWWLHGLEGKQEDNLIDEVGEKLTEPKEKKNYT